MPKPYSLNENVKQSIEEQFADSVVVIPGEIYAAGEFKRFWLGDHYRDTWQAPVKVPVLNLEKAKGGLEIIERGGGMQTYSLKLKGGNDRLYSLRSVQKDPSPTLPEPLQYSFADDLVQDQISASHPHGAFILPPMAEAAGIYHTNPVLYYIPDVPELGKYREEFGGALAMLEQDADEDWSDYKDFGYTENAVSSETVMEEVRDNNENSVDQQNLLRARLFDMWIGDWDRHDGQFRWAELDGERGNIYRPIPEDRDNVFFKFDGVIPWIARRKWALRKFQSFDSDVRDIAGLNYNARYLDRRFLTGLNQDEWVAVAEDLKERLTDEIIEKAVHQFPDTVYELSGEFILKNLKARRDKLDHFAKRYYHILADGVDIVGSDANEYVEVEFSDEGTLVTMYDATDDGEKNKQIYQRRFFENETKEIRIYTRADEDFIYLSGAAKKAPKVRIIAGRDNDVVADSSVIDGWNRNNFIYDNPEGIEIKKKGKDTRPQLAESLDVNHYDYEDFNYDYLGPTAFLGYNTDDGVYIGGGVIIKKHGFRKDPYASRHEIDANVAPKSLAWNFNYEGDWKRIIGDLGLNVDASVRAPNFFTNFYGFGNETEVDESRDEEFFEVRFEEVNVYPGITFDAGKNAQLKMGPQFQYVDVIRQSDNILANADPSVFEASHYVGARLTADIKTIESTIYPENGIRWITSMAWLGELDNENNKFSKLRSEISAYYSIEEPTLITFAARIGGATNAGQFEFYQANTIGGNAGLGRQGNVRGFERDRFSGRSSIYQNNEIRVRMARIPFYYLPMAIGFSLHLDQGRVWADNENSDKWHRGFGGGIWFNPLGKWVFTTTYTHSDEQDLLMLNLGFLF